MKTQSKNWPASSLVTAMLLIAGSVLASAPSADEQAQVSKHTRDMGKYYAEVSTLPGDALSAWTLASMLDVIDSTHPQFAAAATAARAAHPIGPDAEPTLVAARLTNQQLPFSAEDRAKAVQTLLDAAGDNSHFAILLMSQPEFRDDPEAFNGLLHLAAGAPVYDGGFSRKVKGLYERLLQRPLPPEPQVGAPSAFEEPLLSAAVAIAAMDGFLPINAVSRRCKESVGQVRKDCHALATHMRDGAHTVIDGLFAGALLSLSAESAEEAADAVETKRRFAWKIEQGNPEKSPIARQRAADLRLYRETLLASDEITAINAQLETRGVPISPPAGWQPTTYRLDAAGNVISVPGGRQ